MAVVKLGKPVKSNLGGPNGAMAYIIDPAKTDGGRLVSSNYERTGTDYDALADPMLDHACTMRIALAIARRQNELDLRLHRIEQALKLGGHANFPSTDRNQPTTQKDKERPSRATHSRP